MIKANKQEIEMINQRYNHIRDDLNVGIDYMGEGAEITDFEVDDKGRTTIIGYYQYLNNQFALRTKHFERHPRLKKDEIDYVLGKGE